MTLVISIIICGLLFLGLYEISKSKPNVTRVMVQKSRLPSYWYADKIGETFLVKNDKNNSYSSYETLDGKSFIQKEDCVEIFDQRRNK